MMNEPVTFLFIAQTIGVILITVFLGIKMVQRAKKRKNNTARESV